MDAALRFEIEDLYNAYVACLDERRFDDWPGFFTDDCVYKVVPRENHDRGLPLSTLSFESKGMLKDRVYASRKHCSMRRTTSGTSSAHRRSSARATTSSACRRTTW